MKEDMQKEQSEYVLKWALEEQLKQDEEMKRYTSEEDPEEVHEFSAKHEERLKTILKMAEKEEHRQQRKRKNFQVAAGIAVVLCFSVGMAMQSEAFRVPVINFFTEIKEKSTFFGVKEESYLTEKFQDYEPQYTPEGFAVLKMKETLDGFSVEYFNEKTAQQYSYSFYNEQIQLGLDTEDVNTEMVEISETPVWIVQKGEDIRAVVYINGKSIYLAGNISKEEVLKILQSAME